MKRNDAVAAMRAFSVTGRVQGVFFRDSTRREARRLGLTGYAINLPDGSVEVLACGETDRIAELERWLQHGPPSAQVTSVSERPVPESTGPQATFRTG